MCKQASTLGIQVGVKKGASMSPIWVSYVFTHRVRSLRSKKMKSKGANQINPMHFILYGTTYIVNNDHDPISQERKRWIQIIFTSTQYFVSFVSLQMFINKKYIQLSFLISCIKFFSENTFSVKEFQSNNTAAQISRNPMAIFLNNLEVAARDFLVK